MKKLILVIIIAICLSGCVVERIVEVEVTPQQNQQKEKSLEIQPTSKPRPTSTPSNPFGIMDELRSKGYDFVYDREYDLWFDTSFLDDGILISIDPEDQLFVFTVDLLLDNADVDYIADVQDLFNLDIGISSKCRVKQLEVMLDTEYGDNQEWLCDGSVFNILFNTDEGFVSFGYGK